MASNPLLDVAQKTIRDVVAKALTDVGVSEAVGFEITLKNGGTHQILSNDNPLLDRPAAEVARVGIKQSAQAGSGLVTVFKIV